jgi:uncharacterized membrane protein
MKLLKVIFLVLVIILFYVRYFTTTGQEMKVFFDDWRHSMVVVCYGISMYLVGLYIGKTKQNGFITKRPKYFKILQRG